MRRPEAQEYLDKASERLRAGRLLLREKLFDDAASRAFTATEKDAQWSM